MKDLRADLSDEDFVDEVAAGVPLGYVLSQSPTPGNHALGRPTRPAKHSHPQRKQCSKSAEFLRIDEVWDKRSRTFEIRDTEESTADVEYEGYSFHVRRTFDSEERHEQTFVDIKNKLLREALKEVLSDVKSISLVEETPALDPNLLFLYLEDLRQHAKMLKMAKVVGGRKHQRTKKKRNAKKCQQLRILIGYLEEDYKAVAERLNPLLKSGIITFELLWALWKPNTLAFTTTYGSHEPRVFMTEFVEKRKPLFQDYCCYCIEGKYFEYDGTRFGFSDTDATIRQFSGVRQITSLPVYPLAFHSKEKQIRKKLVDRGKMFVALSGIQYKGYVGMAFCKDDKAEITKFNVDGRVVIDAAAHRHINPNYPAPIIREHDSLSGGNNSDSGSMFDSAKQMKPRREATEDADGSLRVVQTPTLDSSGQNETRGEQNKFTSEEYLLASPVVLGFSLANKRLLLFLVSNVRNIQWNDKAYESLVLEPKTKDIVKALVESHQSNTAQTDDFVQGKGKGLVVVLHGPPGTGKTLTAEGISDLFKCPLYMMSAGELGREDLEFKLQNTMEICHTWGAILLLDEADVFLEKRNTHDIHRNALVSIFLRQLEYFQGILFLTTNRVETFDEAFQSRIHIALHYNSLDHCAKRAIFKSFIERTPFEKTGFVPFGEEDLNALARYELNGRQIKNTIRIAQILAVYKGEPLSMHHIQQVIEVQTLFDRDLKGGPGYQDAMRSYF